MKKDTFLEVFDKLFTYVEYDIADDDNIKGLISDVKINIDKDNRTATIDYVAHPNASFHRNDYVVVTLAGVIEDGVYSTSRWVVREIRKKLMDVIKQQLSLHDNDFNVQEEVGRYLCDHFNKFELRSY